MTLTASSSTSAAVDRAAFGDLTDAHPETLLTTTDHRTVGAVMAGAVLTLGTVGFVLAGVLGLRLDDAVRGTLPSSGLASSGTGNLSFDRLLNLARHGLTYLVIAPLFLAVATIAVPRLVGATRMAFPRLQAAVLWAYAAGSALVIAAYFVLDGPPQISVFSIVPVAERANGATGVLIGGLALLAVAITVGAINIAATVLTQRRAGLLLGDVAPFAWASLITAGLLALTTPVFAGGLLLSWLDSNFGSTLYAAQGFERVWLHTVWHYGRPDALLVLLPGLGIASQIVENRAGRKLLGGAASKVMMTAAGVLTLTAWAGGEYVFTSIVQPTSRWWMALPAIPATLLLLIWLGTLAGGVKPDASLLFVIGFILLVGLAEINVIVAAARKVTDPTLGFVWTYNQTTTLLLLAPLVIGLGGLLEFAPLAWGRKVAVPLAGLAALAGIGGGLLHALGVSGISYKDDAADSASALGVIALVGALLVAGAVALTALNLLASVLGRKGALVATADETGIAAAEEAGH